MTDNDTNRTWLIANRLAERERPASFRNDCVETLLYYQAQLEAELREVRQRIAEAVRP